MTWKLTSIFLFSYNLISCSSQELTLKTIQVGTTAASSAWKGMRLINETELFTEHWNILTNYYLPGPIYISKEQKETLEKGLQKILNEITDEYPQLLKDNHLLKPWSGKIPKPKVEIVLSNEVYAYSRQDKTRPKIIISSALLYENLNAFSALMEYQVDEYKKNHANLDDDEFNFKVIEEVKIPRALEYKDALRFVLAHEAVHILLDPPMKEGDVTTEIETIADSLGLVLTGRCSFIVSIKQRIFDINNMMLIYSGNTGDNMYTPVAYARFGPEMLFSLHRHTFDSNSKSVYRSVDERINDSKNYMDKLVNENIHTGYDTLLIKLINSLQMR